MNQATATADSPLDVEVSDLSDDDSLEGNEPTLTSLPVNMGTSIETYVYLEGSLVNPQTGVYFSQMRTTLNDSRLLPGQLSEDVFQGNVYTPVLGTNNQAYNIGPWNYSGSEGNAYDSQGMSANAGANYPAEVVDWVLVSLRSDPTDGSEALCQRAGLLFADGHIEFEPGTDCIGLDSSQSYYLVIEHRNHLLIMSSEAIPIVNGSLNYDFRDKQSYLSGPFNSGAYVGQTEVSPGVYAMHAGNGQQELISGDNEDTDINASDAAKLRESSPASRIYSIADYNMDGEVSVLDLALWRKNTPKQTSVSRQ